MYLITTADEYELPLFLANNAREGANYLGLTYESFFSIVTRQNDGRKQRKYKIFNIKEDLEMDER